VESYSGISVTLNVTVERHAKGSRNIYEQRFLLQFTISFLEALKLQKPPKPFWGLEEDLGIIDKKAVL
jgi:hypothetical protein